MQIYRVRYFDGDSRLLDCHIKAASEALAIVACRQRYGNHIGVYDCSPQIIY